MRPIATECAIALRASLNSKETYRISPKRAVLTGLRVLVADDEINTLEILRAALTNCGATVRTAISASDAFEAVPVRQPNMLISDLGMPNEDGYSLIRKIRALKPEEGGEVLAAALTAYVGEDR